MRVMGVYRDFISSGLHNYIFISIYSQPGSAIHLSLVREAANYKLKYGRKKEATSDLEQLWKQNTNDVHTLAQLISAYSLVDQDKAKAYPQTWQFCIVMSFESQNLILWVRKTFEMLHLRLTDSKFTLLWKRTQMLYILALCSCVFLSTWFCAVWVSICLPRTPCPSKWTSMNWRTRTEPRISGRKLPKSWAKANLKNRGNTHLHFKTHLHFIITLNLVMFVLLIVYIRVSQIRIAFWE